MPTLKVDDIAESTASAGITLKDNVTIDGSKTLTTGTGLTTVSGNLTVDGTTGLNGTTTLNGNDLNDVATLTTTAAVTAGGGIRSHGAVNCLGDDDTTKQNITNVDAIDCQSITIAGTAFAVNLKAFGQVSIADATANGVTVETGDFNISTVSHSASSDTITINFTNDMSGTNYIVVGEWANNSAISGAAKVYTTKNMSKAASNVQITYASTTPQTTEQIEYQFVILEV